MNDPSTLLADSEYGNISDSELAQAIEEVARSLSSIMIKRKVNQVVMLGGMQTFLQALTSRSNISEEQRRRDIEEAGTRLKQMSDYFLQTGAFAPRREVPPPLEISRRSVKQ
jgi:hypothetical protein